MGASLRASEIPQMVDVDGHIDESLMRTIGCHPRRLVEVLEPRFQDEVDGVPWEDASDDTYRYSAANEWLPQPPWALEGWERELYGLNPIVVRGCGCAFCQEGSTLVASLRTAQPDRVWFVPTIENPAAPTLRELEWATRLDAVPQRIVLGFDGAVQAAFREAAELERVNNQLRAVFNFDATPIQAQIERRQAEVDRLQAARVQIDWGDADVPTQDARERALELRRNRNTGPDHEPFRHRGGRR